MSSSTTVTFLYRYWAALEPQSAAAICLGWPWYAFLIWTTMFTPFVIGGTKTSRTPGMPATVRIFHAIAARWTDDITLFSLYEPGSVPSRQPRKIGSLRYVMQVTFMVGRGVGMSDTYPVYSPNGPSSSYVAGSSLMNPSRTISAVAGTSRSTVSHRTSSAGSPR